MAAIGCRSDPLTAKDAGTAGGAWRLRVAGAGAHVEQQIELREQPCPGSAQRS